jgi:hypothetical protein
MPVQESDIVKAVRAQMAAAVREQHRILDEVFFNPPAVRHERMARDAGRVTFGNILTATPDPLAGFRALWEKTP